uniref:Uncharacterized protein n=1 Tax=Molossus molossus TaxID=27622 RepID=A0A7J8HBV3_MOLMO|nr:hypothetical protein HJG59_011122 [Molossus molossus]
MEHLCGVLLVICENLRHVPGLLVFSWEILVGALVVVSLIAKRRHTSGSVKAPGKWCSVCEEVSENIGPMTEADALKSSGVEASPLLLQTLCLRALSKHMSKLSLQDMVNLLKMARKSQPPKLSQVTDEKPISKASGIDEEQLQKNTMDNLNKNTHPESAELLQEEMMGWKQKIQEKEEKQRQAQLYPKTEQVLQDIVSQ